MNYLRGAISAASQYYRDINPSTLTGAIDVIVVRRSGVGENGADELACSPFHVRFGKWQVLRPVDKKVTVCVNGQEIPFSMKIGDAGEAFFVFETNDDVPEDLITSPIISAMKLGHSSGDMQSDLSGTKTEGGRDDYKTEPDFFNLDSPNISKTDLQNPPTSERPQGAQVHFPETESTTTSTSEDSGSLGLSGILDRSTGLGKAVVKAVIETERDKRHRIQDKASAAHNAAMRTYGRLQGNEEKGDEALPRMRKGEGDPPKIVYSHDMVYDPAGYHAKDASTDSTMTGTSRRTSRSTLREDVDDYDSYEGPSTPRSGDLSVEHTPSRTPDTSRSPSPDYRYDRLTKFPKHVSNPTIRASSESPEADVPPEGSTTMYSWEWGAFPTPSPMQAAFPPREQIETHRSVSVPPFIETDADNTHRPPSSRSKTESALPSPPASPITPGSSAERHFFAEGIELSADENNGRRFLVVIGRRTYDFELSISEELAREGPTGDEFLDRRRFQEGQVSFRRFMKFPAVVKDSNLVIRWNDKYITRRDGSPLMDALVKWRERALARPANARALEEEEPLSSEDERPPEKKEQPKKTSSSWVRWWRSSRTDTTPTKPVPEKQSTPRERSWDRDLEREAANDRFASAPASAHSDSGPVPFPSVSISTSSSLSSDRTVSSGKQYAKTLRLTSDQLKQLNLKSGKNSITFSLSDSGETACTASIFLWESTDSVVVSDIDGTITKSDALGHIYTMIGRDWTHIGVAKLYTDICRNGYRIMYLTSRAIGQADSTRYYLKGINQNNYQLPEGPVIMSPDRLMASFHREVILRKPEVFKMACLRDIQRLFGEGTNPFYAGFGNRITDALSYRSVNIPSQRIFTIDSSGEVKMELLEVAGYKSSYIHLTDLVDQMFPPIHQKSDPEFSDINYWRTPIQEYELPDLSPPSPALSARSDTTSASTFQRLRNFSLRGGARPPPYTAPEPANNNNNNSSGFDRLVTRQTKSTESFTGGTGLFERETSPERKARHRLSMESIPGSLSGSQVDFEDFDEEEENEIEGENDDSENEEVDEYDTDRADPEEAAEEEFDDDLLATGEMESVPFL